MQTRVIDFGKVKSSTIYCFFANLLHAFKIRFSGTGILEA